jgi:acyl carrier protein
MAGDRDRGADTGPTGEEFRLPDCRADQSALLAKCGEILGVSQLRADDDFFGVGGDSLDAVEVCALLGRELGREIDMETVLRSPSFGDLLDSLIGKAG